MEINEAESSDDVLLFIKERCLNEAIFKDIESSFNRLIDAIESDGEVEGFNLTYSVGTLFSKEGSLPENALLANGSELIIGMAKNCNPGFRFALDANNKIVDWTPRHPGLPVVLPGALSPMN